MLKIIVTKHNNHNTHEEKKFIQKDLASYSKDKEIL